MNLDMKEEMENIREESLLKSEHLTKLEKRNDQLQQEVSIWRSFIFLAWVLQSSKCGADLASGRIWDPVGLKHLAARSQWPARILDKRATGRLVDPRAEHKLPTDHAHAEGPEQRKPIDNLCPQGWDQRPRGKVLATRADQGRPGV